MATWLFWRSAGAAITSPMAIIAFLELVVGPIVIGALFSAAAILTYIGAWGSTLGFLRVRNAMARHAVAAAPPEQPRAPNIRPFGSR